MSGKLMGKVFGLTLNRGERDVLLALCDHADDDGRNAHPGVSRLAWKTDLSTRQVERHLRALRQKGIIRSVAGGGNKLATTYLIDLSKGTPKPVYTPKSYDRQRVSSDTQMSDDSPDTQMSDDPASPDISSTDHPTFRVRSSDISERSSDIQMSSPTSSEPSEEPPLTTGTARSASPVVGVVVGQFGRQTEGENTPSGGSRHAPEDIKAYVEDCRAKGQQNIRSVDAVTAKLRKTGEADKEVQGFLDRRSRESVDVAACPDCHGRTWVYLNPNIYAGSVRKCRHERLMAEPRAS